MDVKDSGEREQYPTGANRDLGIKKPNPLADLDTLNNFTYRVSGEWFDPITMPPDFSEMPKDELWGLVPDEFLNRLQTHLEKGAAKYGENNWQKGIPLQRIYESLVRHAILAAMGDNVEDHLAAVAFNAMAAMIIERKLIAGEYGEHHEYLSTAGVPKRMIDIHGKDYHARIDVPMPPVVENEGCGIDDTDG